MRPYIVHHAKHTAVLLSVVGLILLSVTFSATMYNYGYFQSRDVTGGRTPHTDAAIALADLIVVDFAEKDDDGSDAAESDSDAPPTLPQSADNADADRSPRVPIAAVEDTTAIAEPPKAIAPKATAAAAAKNTEGSLTGWIGGFFRPAASPAPGGGDPPAAGVEKDVGDATRRVRRHDGVCPGDRSSSNAAFSVAVARALAALRNGTNARFAAAALAAELSRGTGARNATANATAARDRSRMAQQCGFRCRGDGPRDRHYDAALFVLDRHYAQAARAPPTPTQKTRNAKRKAPTPRPTASPTGGAEGNATRAVAAVHARLTAARATVTDRLRSAVRFRKKWQKAKDVVASAIDRDVEGTGPNATRLMRQAAERVNETWHNYAAINKTHTDAVAAVALLEKQHEAAQDAARTHAREANARRERAAAARTAREEAEAATGRLLADAEQTWAAIRFIRAPAPRSAFASWRELCVDWQNLTRVAQLVLGACPPPASRPAGVGLAAFFPGNDCGGGATTAAGDDWRSDYVAKLVQAGVAVDRFGTTCPRTTGNPRRQQEGNHAATWSRAFGRQVAAAGWRKFCLAFDRERGPNHLSARLVSSWVSGCVPIYGGRYADVAAIAPGPRSYLDVRDFPDAGALAAYLVYLDKNHSAYLEHFAWKRGGVSDAFAEFVAGNVCLFSGADAETEAVGAGADRPGSGGCRGGCAVPRGKVWAPLTAVDIPTSFNKFCRASMKTNRSLSPYVDKHNIKTILTKRFPRIPFAKEYCPSRFCGALLCNVHTAPHSCELDSHCRVVLCKSMTDINIPGKCIFEEYLNMRQMQDYKSVMILQSTFLD